MQPEDNLEKTIFCEALELPLEERSAYVKGACRGDEQLQQRIRELLSASDEQTDQALKGSAPAGESSRTLEGVGSMVGRYKLLQVIGEGGCGVVYMAAQEEPVKRRLALKLIKLGMDTREVICRFESERQALALMDHPNIAKVLDAGSTESGRPYFVMELVRGVAITRYCDENRLDTGQRLSLFVQVCHAIQHAHQKGIIHRDIKPSNVLVADYDGLPVPKVIDFGIAKATAGQILTNKTLFTALEQFIGTPAYMSPEQAKLSGLDIDTRSDIYSLGILLYELLTGKTPFDSKRLLDAGLDEIRRIIREEEPVRPSTRFSTLGAAERETVAKLRQSEPLKLIGLIRGDLDWIVMKALEKDRNRRYDTPVGLAMDIHRHLNSEPVLARPPSRTYRLQKLARRHKLAFIAMGIVFAALVTGLGISLWSLRRAQRETTRSQQVSRFFGDILDGAGPSKARGRDATMLRELLDQTAQRLDGELKGQEEVQADLCTRIGKVYLDLGYQTNAEAMFSKALSLRTKGLGNEHVEVAAALNNLATALWDEGRLKEAEAIYRQALLTQRKILGSENPEVATTLGNLGSLLGQQGDKKEAEARLREALAMRKKLLGNEHPKVADSLNNLGNLFREESKLEEAESLQREALAIRQKLLGNNSPEVAGNMNNLANTLWEEGKLTAAEELFRNARTIQEKVLGSEHPSLAGTLNNLAALLGEEGKLEEAENAHRQVLTIRQKRLGNDHPEVARTLNNLATVVCARGRQPEAENLFREALAIKRKRLNIDSPEIANTLIGLAVALQEQGKVTEAAGLYRDALAIQRKAFGNEHPYLVGSLCGLAAVLREQNSLQESESNARQALELAKKLPENDGQDLASALGELAETLLQERAWAEAESLARQCLAFREKRSPNDWETLEAKSLLAGSLLGQNKFSEAEPLLSAALIAMKEPESMVPAPEKRRLKDLLLYLVRLYEAADKPEQAARLKLGLGSWNP